MLETIWNLMNTGIGMTVCGIIFIFGLSQLYKLKPGWEKYEGFMIMAVKQAEKWIPNDTDNEFLSKADKALDFAVKAYEKQKGKPPLGNGRGEFHGDQGILNYLAYSSGTLPLPLEDVYAWGAKPIPKQSGSQNNPTRHVLVHWAGCPRPQPLAYRHIPAGNEWWTDFLAFHRPVARWLDLVLGTTEYESRLLIFRARQFLKRQRHGRG